MFRSKEKDIDREDKIIKELKRTNRRYEGIVLLGVLQVSALALCYYLGKSKGK